MKKYLHAFDPTFIGGTGSARAARRGTQGLWHLSAEKQVCGSSYTYRALLLHVPDRSQGPDLRALMPYGHSPDDYVHDLKILLKE